MIESHHLFTMKLLEMALGLGGKARRAKGRSPGRGFSALAEKFTSTRAD